MKRHLYLASCLSVLCISSTTPSSIHASGDQPFGPTVSAIAAVTLVGTALWLVTRISYGNFMVNLIRNRFAQECIALRNAAWYSQNGYGWTSAHIQQLCSAIKTYAISFHNQQRDRYGIAITYDLLLGRAATYIDPRYYAFPLMHYLQDINSYINHLRFICICRLSDDPAAARQLLEDLIYIRQLIQSDMDLNREEQAFAQNQQLQVQTEQMQQIEHMER